MDPKDLPFVMMTAPRKFTFIRSTKSATGVLSKVPFRHTPAIGKLLLGKHLRIHITSSQAEHRS